MAGKLISDLNSGTLSLADAMEIDKDVSGTRTSFKTTVKDIVDFANHNVAEEYDSTSTYAIGDYVMYESTLYKCITAVSSAENFDSTKWTAVLVTDEMGSGGGGGTGGHTIINENGTSMPARAGLQFVGGANVSDDATNNRTIVDLASAGGIDGVFIDTDNVITSGTYSNSSPLSYTATEDCIAIIPMLSDSNDATNGQTYVYINGVEVLRNRNGNEQLAIQNAVVSLKKGQILTATTGRIASVTYTVYGIQTGTTHSKFQPVIYSTEEREIGVWTDGKPLYEKTLTGLNIAITSAWSNTFGDSLGIETLANAIFYDTTVSANPIIVNVDNKQVLNGGIRIQAFNTELSNRTITVAVLQYTKTTDTAGSGSWTPQGVPAHHYLTDEHIVGTWVDGSTIYEKSYLNLGLALPANQNNWTDTHIPLPSGIDTIISANAIDNNGQCYPLSCAKMSSTQTFGMALYFFTNRNIEIITIQYTKSS